MPSTTRLSINPQALKWVKKNFDLSDFEVAKKLGIDEEHYLEYESGNIKPTIRQVQLLSKRLKTAVAVFYLKTLPNGHFWIRS